MFIINHARLIILLCLMLVIQYPLMGCAYRADRQQGQLLEKEQIALVKKGMDQNTIVNILGEPLLVHPFRESEWIYPYYIWREDDSEERQHYIIRFDDNNQVSQIISTY